MSRIKSDAFAPAKHGSTSSGEIVAVVEAASAKLLGLLVTELPLILDRLQTRRSDMDRYRYLMTRVWQCDVRSDAAFQRTFNGLYMVRRGALWREAFYELFEDEKSRSDRNFERVLTALHNATGRIEASFASKLHATIDPHMPVYDSWVRLNMSLKARSGPAQLRVPALCADYESIASSYAWIMGQPDYAHVRAAFDDALPDLRDIGDVKKVDLLLWQSRSP